MADNSWKEEAERGIRASIAHLSNDGKTNRERWVVERLLAALDVQYTDDGLTKGDEPADVAFRDARFQVKELMDDDRKRLDEFRADLRRLETATQPSDMHTHYEPKDLPIAEVITRVEKLAAELTTKYGPVERRTLDLLVYVNLLDTEIVDNDAPLGLTRPPGFRSVAFVADGRAVVLWAEPSAPDFLRQNAGRVRRGKAPE